MRKERREKTVSQPSFCWGTGEHKRHFRPSFVQQLHMDSCVSGSVHDNKLDEDGLTDSVYNERNDADKGDDDRSIWFHDDGSCRC